MQSANYTVAYDRTLCTFSARLFERVLIDGLHAGPIARWLLNTAACLDPTWVAWVDLDVSVIDSEHGPALERVARRLNMRHRFAMMTSMQR